MIDQQRLFLYMALGFLALLLYQAWLTDQSPATTPASPLISEDQPTADLPPLLQQTPENDLVRPSTDAFASSDESQRLTVRTDLLAVEIDRRGGTIVRLNLLDYPLTVTQPETTFPLLDLQSSNYFVAQSGLQAQQGFAPNHHFLYQSDRQQFVLPTQDETLDVRLYAEHDGLLFSKTLTFHRGSYVIDIVHAVDNGSAQTWIGSQYAQFQHHGPAEGNTLFNYSYYGSVFSSPQDRYQKFDFDELAAGELEVSSKESWLALVEHYFLAAWIPEREEEFSYYSKRLKSGEGRYMLGAQGPVQQIPAQGQGQFAMRIYAGPKEQTKLDSVAPFLALTIDYGVLAVIADALFWLLRHIHSLLGNWGWSIVVLTFFVKLLFYKLSEKSYRSMAQMRRLQPRLKMLRERFGNDRKRLGAATMEMYKKERVSVFSGCLPILIQIPVFISLYWVLLESVELRQAPWILWIEDLSIRDPYYVLPVIMGASMLAQQYLNPQPVDPIQQKVLLMMPFFFSFFLSFSPSGLVLYWVVNNLLSILQQWYIMRHVMAAPSRS